MYNTHTHGIYYPDQFWQQKVIRAYLMRTFIRIYYPDPLWLQKVIRAYLICSYVNYQVWISFGSSGPRMHKMYRALAVLCSCIGRKGMFFHACMRACRYPSGSIYAMDLSLYRSEQQLVKWSPVDQHIAKICIYII